MKHLAGLTCGLKANYNSKTIMTKRRDFVRKSIIAGAGISIGGMGMSARSYASVIGANDRLNVAVIGAGGRGGAHVSSWCSLKDKLNINLKTICDADELMSAQKAEIALKSIGSRPSTAWDMRKVYDDSDIQIVSVATTNHWHALATIWACQAGKNVYVEKPACHNVFEGRKMVEAARKYNVRVQVGFQGRSYENVKNAIKFLHDGGIGEVYMARGMCFKPRDSFGIAPDSEPPKNFHYDNWLGPAQYKPFNEKYHPYNWHWFWDTGNGDSGNQGVHEFDFVRWGMNKHEHPVSVFSSGGIYGMNPSECAQQTPNTQMSVIKYADGKIIEFETRGRYTNRESQMGVDIGVIYYGTGGYLEMKVWDADGDKWSAYRKREKEPFAGSGNTGIREAPSLTGSDAAEHYTNFVNAVRSGNDSGLAADIQEGYYSSALPLLANISYRVGRELKFDGKNEKFVNDKDADALLTRQYRKPYVVPDKV
jgi:predicted dehydrogenase